jgi:hypothetical protein
MKSQTMQVRMIRTAEDIADLEREFSILPPVIFDRGNKISKSFKASAPYAVCRRVRFDRENKISKSFKVPDCCDYIYLYAPSNSQPLAVSYTQL